uniref:DUF629 domain-containing protein n=1 Tax=Leersia perrieri TaxID=77586 RepID=A0A0D9XTU6_9ORYZ
MADAAGKDKDVRKGATAALMRDLDGNHEDALSRAVKLARANPGSALALRLAGDLHHEAALRARKVAAGTASAAARKAEREASAHLASARDALSKARRLAPDCVDVASAYADVLASSSMLQDAEVEYRSALAIPLPVDPALNNAAYWFHGRVERTTVNARVALARDTADIGYGRLKNRMIDASIAGMLKSAADLAAADEVTIKAERDAMLVIRKNARAIVLEFPGSARAHYFHGYTDLKLTRLLDESIDKRSLLRRSTLAIADRAAEKFPNSAVQASFRAKLLYILGEYDAAESECRRGLAMKNPDDPADDCIPPGAIGGLNHGARLVTLASEFHEVINKILWAADAYWNSMTQEKRREFLSVRFDALQEDYNKVDSSSSFNVSDVPSLGEKHKSYRFWVCPLCDCNSKKHTDTVSLLSHMCSKHQRAVLPRLQSVLDQKLDCSAFEGDETSCDMVTFSKDSDQQDIVCFKERDRMFRWLFDKPSSGVKTSSLAQLIETKCRRGAILLDHIKGKLKNLSTDKHSAEFAEALPGIQELWISFVKESAIDYRGVILAIGRSLLWRKLKKCMSEDPEFGAKRITAADIDEMLAIVGFDSGSSAAEAKTQAHMSSHSDEAQQRNEDRQESDVYAETRSSGTTVNMKSQYPPTNMDENGNNLDEQLEKLEIDPNSARPSSTSQPTKIENGAHNTSGSSGQFSEETTNTNIYQKGVDILNQTSEVCEDIFFLHLIIQAMWNLRPFRNSLLNRPPVNFQSSHDGSCIADIFYDIFSAWEKNDHQRTFYSLTSLKTNLCQIAEDINIFQKLRAGRSFSSEILAIVLKGLHMSEASLHFYFDDKIQGQVIKSFADLLYAMNEQLCDQEECQSCGNLKNIDHFLLNTPDFFSIVLNCTDSSESHVSLSKLLVGCKSPPDITLTTKYTLASMICCSDGQYVCISRDQNKWLIYDIRTLEAEDSWERLVQRFADSELRPEVIFFEMGSTEMLCMMLNTDAGNAAEIMRMHHEGRFTEAINRAVKLGLKNQGSTLALNLIGTLHQIAYTACSVISCREEGGFGRKEGSAEAKHKRSALAAFSNAAWLAPNCVDIAVSHSEMLAEHERCEEAQAELLRALQISDPDDPAEHDVGCDVYDGETKTRAERVLKARVRCHHAMDRLETLIRGQFIPGESVKVLEGIELGGDAAAEARARAKHLAVTFPWSPRAQLLRVYVDLQRVRGFDAAIDKRRFLQRTLGMVHDVAETFHCSLVIALFRARLLFVLDQYDDVERECNGALEIDNPDDPSADDLPPGSVSGAEYGDRVTFVKNQLRTLMKKMIFAAGIYSRILTHEEEDSLMSVRVKSLTEHCNATDKSSAKIISDALRFFKGNNSWSFWICPLSSRCDGRKFVDTSSLWKHLCGKHPEASWEKLQSVLGPKLSDNTPEGDSSLEWLTFGQDSDQHDIFRLIKMDDMFNSLIRLAAGGLEPDFVEMRKQKCREGAEILEGIKKRLRTMPADLSSSQSKLKERMAGDPNIVGHIDASKIDPIFDDAPSAHGRNFSIRHNSIPSNGHKMGTTSRQNLKPSCSNGTLKVDEGHQESEVCVEDGKSGAKAHQKLSCPPMDVEGTEMEIAKVLANMERNLGLEVTYGQSGEEMANTTSYESVDILNKENTDKDLFILHAIIQSLWNLRYLRDEFLMGTPAWILNINDNYCIAELIHGIFSAWSKNEHDGVAVLLASVKASLCEIANENMFQKLQAGKNLASKVVATILQGLHISEASLHFCFNSEIGGRVIKSFAEVPVLYDDQLCFEDNCEYCGNPKNVDVSLSNTPHFFTIGLDWFGGSENQGQLTELLVGSAHPIDIKLLCKGVHSSINYSLASMISYADGRYVCFARDQDKWLICDAQTIEVVDSWEQLLDRFRDCKLRPEVLFFEVIK